MIVCPHCQARAVEITLHEDERRRFLCIGQPPHEWLEGDEPPQPEPDDDVPEITVEAIADAIADRLKVQSSRPSLLKRLFG